MTHIDLARHAILDLGSEDYYHLGDAAANLASLPADQRREIARQAMLQLVEEGKVQLFFGRMATNEVKSLNPKQALIAVNDPTSWNLHGSDVYCFANTSDGDAAYQSGNTTSS
jgi:hypothetical protein